MSQPMDLTKVHTRVLLGMLNVFRKIEGTTPSYDRVWYPNDPHKLLAMADSSSIVSYYSGDYVTRELIKKELATRPHILSKREGSAMRRERMKRGV